MTQSDMAVPNKEFTPRFDGLYQSELVSPRDNLEKEGRSYFRFFPDGTFCSTFVENGTPEEVGRWLRPGFAASVGPFPYDALGVFGKPGEFGDVQYRVEEFTADSFTVHFEAQGGSGTHQLSFVAI